jgi:hypothetical protein
MDKRTADGVPFYNVDARPCHRCGRHVVILNERDHPERGRILVCNPCDFAMGRDPSARDPLA